MLIVKPDLCSDSASDAWYLGAHFPSQAQGGALNVTIVSPPTTFLDAT